MRRRRRVIVLAVCTAVALAASWKVSGLIRAARAGSMAAISVPAADPKAVLHQWRLDRVRRKTVGTASFYASSFDGRTMADGTPMRPHGNNAASRTLPLGTTAMVTNLSTGKTAIVTIRDRGPYVGGRIVDLSPGTAHKIGLTPKQGLAKVEVAPLEVPMPDGTIKPGLSDSEARTEDLRLARVARLTPPPALAQLSP
jgi:rare lipoprotein A